jgi:hypothetical protein
VLGVPLAPGIDSTRGLLRLWSVRWIIVGTVAETLPRAWATLPPEWAAPMPEPLKISLGYLVLFALVSAGVSRAIRQAPDIGHGPGPLNHMVAPFDPLPP